MKEDEDVGDHAAAVKGDPRRLEEHVAQNRETIEEIIAQAKEHGLIAHRF